MNMLSKTTGALALAAFTAASTMAASPALAGEYPDKTVRAIVPFGAGGGTDRRVRVMSSAGFDVFEGGMRIENRGAAAGTVGWKAMMAKPADGHTLLMASPTPVIAALLATKSVSKLIGKLGEVIIYLPADKAQAAYAKVLAGAKANQKYFQ